jgi:hypothetical protein
VKFFCCRVRPAGIADQLFQLRVMRDVGLRLGLGYLYQPLEVNPAAPDFDFADFLGLAAGEDRVDGRPPLRRLQRSAFAAAEVVASGGGLAVLGLDGVPDTAMLELVWDPRLYRAPPAGYTVRHRLGLRQKFLARQGGRGMEGPGAGLLVCVHIRLGDCTWVPYGGRYVLVGQPLVLRSPDHPRIRRAVPVARYRELLESIVRLHGPSIAELRVYSDGPAAAERRRIPGRGLLTRVLIGACEGRVPKPLAWAYDPMALRDVADRYAELRSALDGLGEIPGVRLLVGTGADLTRGAITDFARADVVIQPRRGPRFPGLGLGDPRRQLVLSMEDDAESSLAALSEWLQAGPLSM